MVFPRLSMSSRRSAIPTLSRRRRLLKKKRRRISNLVIGISIALLSLILIEFLFQSSSLSLQYGTNGSDGMVERYRLPGSYPNSWLRKRKALYDHLSHDLLAKMNKYRVEKDIELRFLIFHPPLEAAQGIGNMMNGLLAAHLLGQEFNRTVCISDEWQKHGDFGIAFEPRSSICIWLQNNAVLPKRTAYNSMRLINFARKPINECVLHERLVGAEEVLYLIANAYPRWPQNRYDSSQAATTSILPSSPSFEDWYRPKKSLLRTLPWTLAPKTVVHLRASDDVLQDPRIGLDLDTINALGSKLRNDTYLVTNQPQFYNVLESKYGWSHPFWTGDIQHSALPHIHWGNKSLSSSPLKDWKQKMLELWSDWWTIYNAGTVYHTLSDFSLSAIRWRRHAKKMIVSFTIQGVDQTNGTLLLENDYQDAKNATVLPLSQRSYAMHQNCHRFGDDGIGNDFNLDDSIHDDDDN